MESIETLWILGEHGATRVPHWLPGCWHPWAFDICCDPAGGIACQEGHNLQVHSLITRAGNRHAARVDVGRYSQGNLQAMLLQPVCNAWSCHQHREPCDTRSHCGGFVERWEAGVPSRVLRSALLGLFAADHPVASKEYCSSWLELAGERPLRWCALRASGGSWKIHCQLSYIQTTLSGRQQNSRDVFCRTWTSREHV